MAVTANMSRPKETDPRRPVPAAETSAIQSFPALALSWIGPLQASPAIQNTVFGQFGRMQLELTEAYLHSARGMIDLWRTSIRDQQDLFLAGWRTQLTVPAATEKRSSPPAPETSVRKTLGNSSDDAKSHRATRQPKVVHVESVLMSREH